ncbi:hypothetical protein ACFVWG_17915 [Kribbella sp. NPDC058245]|uniref:hypothetical protein n=1 Tax=Kribbella sp. NPDC058245 TaxID=3346399 RepID=UPI0036E79F4E
MSDDVLHMFLEPAEQYLTQLGTVGPEVNTGWENAKAAIDAGAAGLGGDAIGAAFTAAFTPASEAVRLAGDRVPVSFGNLHEAGLQAFQRYQFLQSPPALRKLLGSPIG